MSVETRFVVIRHNEEVKTFMDKKSADEYDKMLEMADGISELLSESPITINDNDKETLSIYFAQKKDELLIALQAKKAKPASKKVNKPVLEQSIDEGLTVEEECAA